MTWRILFLTSLNLLLCCSCVHKPAPPSSTYAPSAVNYLDLQSGWLIQAVIPKVKSGGYVVPSVRKTQSSDGNIQVGDEFLGYEKDLYRLLKRPDGGNEIRFVRADVWENGKTRRVARPTLNLFEEASRLRMIRLVYLIRISAEDHNMAIVAADNAAMLDKMTSAVTQHGTCEDREQACCRWVPEGVAVRHIEK